MQRKGRRDHHEVNHFVLESNQKKVGFLVRKKKRKRKNIRKGDRDRDYSEVGMYLNQVMIGRKGS